MVPFFEGGGGGGGSIKALGESESIRSNSERRWRGDSS